MRLNRGAGLLLTVAEQFRSERPAWRPALPQRLLVQRDERGARGGEGALDMGQDVTQHADSSTSWRSAASFIITPCNIASSGAASVTTGKARSREIRSGRRAGQSVGARRAVNRANAPSSRARLIR